VVCQHGPLDRAPSSGPALSSLAAKHSKQAEYRITFGAGNGPRTLVSFAIEVGQRPSHGKTRPSDRNWVRVGGWLLHDDRWGLRISRINVGAPEQIKGPVVFGLCAREGVAEESPRRKRRGSEPRFPLPITFKRTWPSWQQYMDRACDDAFVSVVHCAGTKHPSQDCALVRATRYRE